MATMPNPVEEVMQDFQFPQREAAFFYGLFLRGIPPTSCDVIFRCLPRFWPNGIRKPFASLTYAPYSERIVQYRQHVLAIFENSDLSRLHHSTAAVSCPWPCPALRMCPRPHRRAEFGIRSLPETQYPANLHEPGERV